MVVQITETFYAKNRKKWRAWLTKNHKKKKDIWLITYLKATGKESIPYNDAVEEAICFGWIDSTVKKLDDKRTVQRFTPRKPKGSWSPMNKERARRLINQGKMTPAGLAKLGNALDEVFKIPADILKDLKKDKDAWKNFQKFPESYKRIRIGWIDGARNRSAEFKKRLAYFLKMTSKNKRFGMVQ